MPLRYLFNLHLKRDLEIRIPRIGRHLGYVHVPHVATEGFLNIGDAAIDVIRGTLGKHLNTAVRQIPHKARQLMTSGYPVHRKPKSHPLHSS